MITLDSGKAILASGASGSVIVTIDGMELAGTTQSYKQLSQGAVSGEGAALYTATGVTAFIKTIFIVSNSASTETIIFYLGQVATTNEIYTVVLPANGTAMYTTNNGWDVFDSTGKSITGLNSFNLLTLGGNTAGVMASLSSGTVQFFGGNNIILGQNGNTISISGKDQAMTFYDNLMTASASATMAVLYQSLQIFPILAQQFFPAPMTVQSWWFDITGSVASTGAGQTLSTANLVFRVGLYTVSAGTKLNLLNSASVVLFAPTNTYSVQQDQSSAFHGNRWIQLTSGNWSTQCSLTPGRYYCAIQWAASSGGATSTTPFPQLSLSMYGQSYWGTMSRSGLMGSVSTANTTNIGMHPFLGIYSASSNGIPQTIGSADINKQSVSGNFIPHMILNNLSSQL